jgi:3-dehydroquinate dehydratase type I
MNRPRICGVITNTDIEAVKRVENSVDIFEVRIDLIGKDWQSIVVQLEKPWMATNRNKNENGKWEGTEEARVAELFKALEMGPVLVDIELHAEHLPEIVKRIKEQAKCVISFHDWEGVMSVDELEKVVKKELDGGADICKVITAARKTEDNVKTLQLISRFPKDTLISSCRGQLGSISRILGPLIGGYFTFAAVEEGKGSSPGQLAIEDLRKLYDVVGNNFGF